jgi:hypothetical protein
MAPDNAQTDSGSTNAPLLTWRGVHWPLPSLSCMLQVLDAYGHRVNTDDLMSTSADATPPVVAVSINRSNVFLSGIQMQPALAGLAVLDDLRLVAEPGTYNLACQSDELRPAVVTVRPLVHSCNREGVPSNARASPRPSHARLLRTATPTRRAGARAELLHGRGVHQHALHRVRHRDVLARPAPLEQRRVP